MEYISKSLEDTRKIAKEFANTLKIPSVVALYGDLGVGKSEFARAIIKHLKGNIVVPSPTFTIFQNYDDISHFDLYRVSDKSELEELGFYYSIENNLTIIEWPEIAKDVLPSNTINIQIKELNDNKRLISILCP